MACVCVVVIGVCLSVLVRVSVCVLAWFMCDLLCVVVWWICLCFGCLVSVCVYTIACRICVWVCDVVWDVVCVVLCLCVFGCCCMRLRFIVDVALYGLVSMCFCICVCLCVLLNVFVCCDYDLLCDVVWCVCW